MFILNRLPLFLYSPDGAGGQQVQPPAAPQQPTQQPPSTQPEVATAFQNLVSRQGSLDAAGLLLFQENKQHRDKIRELESQVRDLQGKLPGEGAAVLDKDNVALWQAYQTLGKPDELKQVKAEYGRLQRTLVIQEAAEAHKFKPSVLSALAGELAIEVKQVEQNGQKTAVAVVKAQDGKETPLPEYASTHWADFLPSLQVAPAQTTTPFPRQHIGGKTPATSPIQAELNRRYQRQEK